MIQALVRFRAPANLYLKRAQLILLLVAVVPTVLATPVGIILLVGGGSNVIALVSGILVLSFAGAAIVGYVVVTLLIHRGASLVDLQNEYLSSISHELRTPMTSMRMFTEALLDERFEDAGERRRSLELLHSEILRLDEFVGQLIDLSRIEAGRFRLERKAVAVEEVVERACSALYAQQLGRERRLVRDVVPGLAVRGDPNAITQILGNLLANAHKHAGPDATICLRVRALGERDVAFEVEDDGPGIPAEERRRVFDRFERGSRAIANKTTGSGLGLAIVQALTRKQGGRIELEDAPGGGALVRLTLRRA